MTIKDINGNIVQVTDLDRALQQADDFRKYKHTDNKHISFDREQKAYWEDMYKKLKQLKNSLMDTSETKLIYIAYFTDSWHSTDSRTLIRVCSNKEKAIKEIKAYCKKYRIPFTQADQYQLENISQTQCSEREMEFEIDTQTMD